MENKAYEIKKYFAASAVLAAVLLSGCQTNAESSDVSGTASVESPAVSSVPPEESSSVSAESSAVSSALPTESSDPFSEEEPPYSEPPSLFPADRIYPDDKLVPSGWLRVKTTSEVEEKIGEVISSDTSAKDPKSALPALMNKNVLCFEMFYGSLLPVDWDAPYNSSDYKNPVYPLNSEYFSNLQSVLEPVYDTYSSSAAEELLHGSNGEPRLTEITGKVYINAMVSPIWSSDPFIARSYVEIKEKTDNKCTFIWHYPDVEMLNPPQNGYEFFYNEKNYTAEYIGGSWKLNGVVFNDP